MKCMTIACYFLIITSGLMITDIKAAKLISGKSVEEMWLKKNDYYLLGRKESSYYRFVNGTGEMIRYYAMSRHSDRRGYLMAPFSTDPKSIDSELGSHCSGTFGILEGQIAIKIHLNEYELFCSIDLGKLDGPEVDLYALKFDRRKKCAYLEWYKDGKIEQRPLKTKVQRKVLK